MTRSLILMFLILSLSFQGGTASVCWNRYENPVGTDSTYKGSTLETRDILEVAAEIAAVTGAREVTPIHIFVAAHTGKTVGGHDMTTGTLATIVREMGLTDGLIKVLKDNMVVPLEFTGGQIAFNQQGRALDLNNVPISDSTVTLLKKAIEAKESENASSANPSFRNNYVSPEHLILGAMNTPGPLRDFFVNNLGGSPSLLSRFGLSSSQAKTAEAKAKDYIRQVRGNSGRNGAENIDSYTNYERVTYRSAFESSKSEEIPYTTNLNARAKEGGIPRVVINAELIRDILKSMSVRGNNSINITGEIGVGRSSVVYGIVQVLNAVAANPNSPLASLVPANMRGVRVLEFDGNAIVAGTQYRGLMEANIQSMLKQIEACKGQCIIFVRNLEALEGTGKSNGDESSGIGTQLIKSLLEARNNPNSGLRIIGTTTATGNVNFRSSALGQLFKEFVIQAPEKAQMREILHLQLSELLLDRPVITQKQREALVEASIDVMEKYPSIGDRLAGSVRLLSEAALIKETQIELSGSPAVRERYQEVKNIAENLKAEVNSGTRTLEQASDILSQRIESLNIEIGRREILLAAVKILQGAPVGNIISENMRLKLEQLESKVAEQVIGNETLVKRITDAIVASFFRARSGNDPRPMLTYAIFGPSGNGKSTLIKAIADALGIKMTTIDGAKATERDIIGENSSALMRESNQDHLVANVRKTPMQILYFNEMNLANPKVFELLEKILEDGKLADRSGKEAKFENTIVIIDANVAVETIRMLGVSEGKEVTDTQRELIEQMTKNQSELSYPEGSVHLTPEAAAVVKREITAGLGNRAALMGRISNIEVLGYLSKTQAEGIADLLVKQINKRLVEEKGVSLTADKAAREALGELAMQPQNREEGARPIRSQIDRVTDPVIKDLILNQRNWNESGEFIGRYEIQITAVDGVITAKAVVKPEVSAEAAP